MAAALNGVIRRIVDLNFGESVAAPVYELWEQDEIDKTLAERDKNLTDAGVKFTPAYWMRTYNLQEGDLAAPEVTTAATAEFAESTLKPILDQVALDQVINALPAELLQEQAEKAIAPLIEALQQGRTETEALGLLAEVYPQMDDQALQQTLTKLMFMADMWGRLTAAADRED